MGARCRRAQPTTTVVWALPAGQGQHGAASCSGRRLQCTPALKGTCGVSPVWSTMVPPTCVKSRSKGNPSAPTHPVTLPRYLQKFIKDPFHVWFSGGQVDSARFAARAMTRLAGHACGEAKGIKESHPFSRLYCSFACMWMSDAMSPRLSTPPGPSERRSGIGESVRGMLRVIVIVCAWRPGRPRLPRLLRQPHAMVTEGPHAACVCVCVW